MDFQQFVHIEEFTLPRTDFPRCFYILEVHDSGQNQMDYHITVETFTEYEAIRTRIYSLDKSLEHSNRYLTYKVHRYDLTTDVGP